jgi:hypothetical protein
MATNNIAAPRAAVRKRILERCMAAPICWAVPVGGSSSHGGPFGQHCGDSGSPWCDPIKAAASANAKIAKAVPAKKASRAVGAVLGTAVRAR